MVVARLWEVLQHFDAAGNPLAGGKVHTFEAGTSTPKAAFTDSTAGTPHPNPVILDSAGRAQIWLFGAAYKLDIDDANDVDVEELDNVAATGLTGNSLATPAVANATLPCTSGAAQLTASGLVPANGQLVGVYVKNVVAPGAGNGLTGYDIGSHGNASRWGSNVELTLDHQTNKGDWRLPGDQPSSDAAEDITIEAIGGTFDGTGSLQVDIEYETGTNP